MSLCVCTSGACFSAIACLSRVSGWYIYSVINSLGTWWCVNILLMYGVRNISMIPIVNNLFCYEAHSNDEGLHWESCIHNGRTFMWKNVTINDTAWHLQVLLKKSCKMKGKAVAETAYTLYACTYQCMAIPSYEWKGMARHDDVIKWKHLLRYCPFVMAIHLYEYHVRSLYVVSFEIATGMAAINDCQLLKCTAYFLFLNPNPALSLKFQLHMPVAYTCSWRWYSVLAAFHIA